MSSWLPFLVGHAVQAARAAAREDVVDVVTCGRPVGGARVAAHAPLVAGQRIARHAAQEVDLLVLRALGILHALGEHLERRREAAAVHLLLDAAFVAGALVRVDRLAQLAQREPQLALLVALDRDLGKRQREAREQRDDRQCDDQLDEGEPPRGEARHGWGGAGAAAGGKPVMPPGCGWPGCCPGCGADCGMTGGTICGALIAASEPLPLPTNSVPELNCSRRGEGRSMLRTTRGVISSTISLFTTWSLWLEKRRPISGSWLIPGTCEAWRRSSSLIRPASTCVSPSLRRSVVAALRVPSWYVVVPAAVVVVLETLLTSRPILMPTSFSRYTCGSTSSFRPTSREFTDAETKPVAPAVVVTTGTLSPMWMRAFSRLFTRMRGLASTLVRPACSRRLSASSGSVTDRRTLSLVKFFTSRPVSCPGTPAAPITLSAAEPGHWMPRLVSVV